MTIEEKLNSIRETKEAIKTSIKNKGVDVADTDPFSTYAEKIDSIESGGGDLSEYFNTHPTDISNFALSENFVLKMPELTIPENTTNLNTLFGIQAVPYRLPVIPKINYNNNNFVNLQNAFAYISSNVNLDFDGLNTRDVETLANCFYSSSGLTQLDLSGWDIQKVQSMASMFQGCGKLESVIFGNWNTSNLTDIDKIFQSCYVLKEVDLSSITINNVKDLGYMFNQCKALTKIDIRNFDFTSVTSYSNMFGASATSGVPNDCLIIVKDDTAKEWITSKFSRLTNVKTVAELGE